MIAEALRNIQDQAVSAARSDVKHFEEDPEHIYRVLKPDGAVEILRAEPHPIVTTCPSVEELVRSSAELKYNDSVPVIAFDAFNVRLYPDILERLEVWEACFPCSPGWLFLKERLERPIIKSNDLRHELRYKLRGACLNEPALEDIISKASFVDTEGSDEARGRGTESLGASVTKQITDSAVMPPETVTIAVKPTSSAELQVLQNVEVYIDPEPSQRAWIFLPIPGSMEAAESCHLDEVRTLLEQMIKQHKSPAKLVGAASL